MWNPLSRPVALMFLLALALPATVSAQTKDTADIHGVVLDASGRPAAGYPMKVTTSQWGEVILHPTETDGTFTVTGMPPGNYELRVFDPAGSPVVPVASKQLTLAAGQAGQVEIRLGSGHPGTTPGSKPAAGRGTLGAMLDAAGVNWTAVVIAALALAAGLVVFFAVRSQRRVAS